jgi:hypothetical protein
VNDRVGAHFTPPRAYIKRGVDRYCPIESSTFSPEQSLALGGLGAGWGAGCQIFDSRELTMAGLPAAEMDAYYNQVSSDIGICGAPEDDTAEQILPGRVLRPAELDTNATRLFETYMRKRARLNEEWFLLGRAALAMLTEDRPARDGEPMRGANPYYDMDFYADFRRSVYRPRYTIEEMSGNPRFRYLNGLLVERFQETAAGVRVSFKNLETGEVGQMEARSLILAANAINSARIALRSLGHYNSRQPLLCNPYHYLPTIHAAMLGKPTADRRHSLGQLVAIYSPPHRGGEHIAAGVFSYRSLLHFRLVKEMPLPAALGLLVSRTLQSALTIVGIHHPDHFSSAKWIEMRSSDVLAAHYELNDAEKTAVERDVSGVVNIVRQLGCLPIARIATVPGSSIHYAGTIPSLSSFNGLQSDDKGRLVGAKHVYFADASPWTFLPAKGLTFTLMANARRIADVVGRDLRREVETNA